MSSLLKGKQYHPKKLLFHWDNQVKNNSIEQFERLELLMNSNENSIAEFIKITLQIYILYSTKYVYSSAKYP